MHLEGRALLQQQMPTHALCDHTAPGAGSWLLLGAVRDWACGEALLWDGWDVEAASSGCARPEVRSWARPAMSLYPCAFPTPL